MPVEAEVLLDSISPQGDRLTTVELTLHRAGLPELNTHRGLSKNSASSRAIPITKTLKKVAEDPALPLVWGSEKKGMQSGPPLTGYDLVEAEGLFERIQEYTVREIRAYVERHPLTREDDTRLHKSWLNRPLEWFSWHTVILSGTDAMWKNFFRLRSTYFTDKAWAEIAIPANFIFDAMQNSTPNEVNYGEWHTPLIRPEDDFSEYARPDEARKFVSVGRTARVSYLTHAGVRDIKEDLRLAGDLCVTPPDPIHASPFEHVATPCWPRDGRHPGNFNGWRQLRHWVESDLSLGAWSTGHDYINERIGGRVKV